MSKPHVILMAAAAKLLRKTHMTHLFKFMNSTVFLLAHSCMLKTKTCLSVGHVLLEIPVRIAHWEAQKTCRILRLSSPSNKTSHLFYPETGCNGKATEGHHREVKSSRQRTGIGFESGKKSLFSLNAEENDILVFDQGENRGNIEIWSRGERRGKKETLGGRTSEEGKPEREAEGNGVEEILLSELQQGRMWHVESRKRKLDRYRLIW